MPNNYGDVALNLDAGWSRDNLASGHEFMLTAVGHVDGVADLHLRSDPDKRHQFQWCDPLDIDRLHGLRSKKYQFVQGGDKDTDEWAKNPALWDWDGERFCVFKGQRAMFRDASYYIAEKKVQEETRRRELEERQRRRGDYIDADDAYAAKRLGQRGVEITDDHGRALIPQKRARG